MGTVRLYHGTTVAAANQIRAHGFRPVDIDAVIALVAAEFGVDEAALRVAASGTFAVDGPERDRVAFAGGPIRARLYAGWEGGEARREIVGAAFRLTELELGQGEIDRRSKRCLKAPPALITVDADFDSIAAWLDIGRRADDPEPPTWQEWTEDWAPHLQYVKDLRIPAPVPAAWITAVGSVDHIVDADTLYRSLPDVAAQAFRRNNRPQPLAATRAEMLPELYEYHAVDSWLGEVL